MNTTKQYLGFSQKVMVIAIVAAFGPAHAEDEVAQLTNPDSWASAGAVAASGDSKDRSIFGQYNGLRNHSGNVLLDFDLVKRDNATGTWTSFQGRNIGLENREFSASMSKQGDWRVNFDYNEITHREIRTVNTRETGTGTPTVNVLPGQSGTGNDLDLKLERKSYGLAGDKWITPNLQLELTFKNEDKKGARFFGRGMSCSSTALPGCGSPSTAGAGTSSGGVLFLPEPINSTTQQVDMKLNWVGEKLNVSGGYYGSFYVNTYGNVNTLIPGGQLYNQAAYPNVPALLTQDAKSLAALQRPMALPPDNQAHQLYLAGNYAFSHVTRANFKLAYTHATQHEDFGATGLGEAPAGVTNLGGVLDTKLVQIGLTTKPMPKLTLAANFRYEDKQDKTPIYTYNYEDSGGSAKSWTNGHISDKKTNAKLEASYQLPAGYRATVGADFDRQDRGQFTPTDQVAGITALRQKTYEQSYRAELRRAITENFSGAVSYVTATRTGSDWLLPASGNNTGVSAVPWSYYSSGSANYFMPTLSDRKRDKIKLLVDWSPIDKLNLTFAVEDGKDKYNAPGRLIGVRNTGVRFYSIDAAYALADDWKLSGYVSQGQQKIFIQTSGFIAPMNDNNTSAGLGFVGKPTGKLEVGGNLGYTNDINEYKYALDPGTGQSAVNTAQANTYNMPDVRFRQVSLTLYAKYALDKHSDIRMDIGHQSAQLKEWAWNNNGIPFRYSDGTTVSLQEKQSVNYIGARYIYKWQ